MSGQVDTAGLVLTWCSARNASIIFGRDGTVTIRVGRASSRGGTLVEAWREAVDAYRRRVP